MECEHLGIVLAGGAGARLGLGMPKALVRLGGETLLQRAARTLGAVCDHVVITGPKALDFPLPDLGSATAVMRAFDPQGSAGPGAGVMAGLMDQGFQDALVLAVDFPFMTTGALREIREWLGSYEAAVPAPRGITQPLAAAYASEIRTRLFLILQRQEPSLTRALGRFNVRHLDDATLAQMPGGLDNFFNLNTRADLTEAERRIAAGESVE